MRKWTFAWSHQLPADGVMEVEADTEEAALAQACEELADAFVAASGLSLVTPQNRVRLEEDVNAVVTYEKEYDLSDEQLDELKAAIERGDGSLYLLEDVAHLASEVGEDVSVRESQGDTISVFVDGQWRVLA